MVLYLFAGPNGSGKSTLIAEYIREYGLLDTEYICPDLYASALFSDIADLRQRYEKAMNFAAYKRERLLSEGKDMIVETVLSRSDKLDFVLKAKSLGYRVVSIFVGTASADINCLRVKRRAAEGGHDVPEDSIRKRFVRAMSNLPLLAEASDELYVYDNSGEHPLLSLSQIDGELFLSAEAPDWIKNLF